MQVEFGLRHRRVHHFALGNDLLVRRQQGRVRLSIVVIRQIGRQVHLGIQRNEGIDARGHGVFGGGPLLIAGIGVNVRLKPAGQRASVIVARLGMDMLHEAAGGDALQGVRVKFQAVHRRQQHKCRQESDHALDLAG